VAVAEIPANEELRRREFSVTRGKIFLAPEWKVATTTHLAG
jgi:predicted deacetylase